MEIYELEKMDNSFTQSMFITRVNNIFTKLLNGIMFNNLEDVRHTISDNVYNYALNIINENISKNLRKMYDELNIKSTDIYNIYVDNDYYIIEVIITTRYLKYYIKLDNGDYVSGDKTNRVVEKYKLVFKKKKNTKSLKSIRYCTNCGKALDLNNSGKCIYCNTYFDIKKYDYILESIDKI